MRYFKVLFGDLQRVESYNKYSFLSVVRNVGTIEVKYFSAFYVILRGLFIEVVNIRVCRCNEFSTLFINRFRNFLPRIFGTLCRAESNIGYSFF